MKRKRIIELADYWIGKLRLEDWQMTFVFLRTKEDIEKEFGAPCEHMLTLMRTYPSWPYKSAAIYINTPLVKKASDEDVEETLIHELLHAVFDVLQVENARAEEHTVTSLARMLVKMRSENGQA